MKHETIPADALRAYAQAIEDNDEDTRRALENEHAYIAIDHWLDYYQITMVTRFVPASQIDAPADDWRKTAINFQITVLAQSLDIYHGPYAYGVGNLPEFNPRADRTVDGREATARAIETGELPPVPPPHIRDVMHALISDSNVIDYRDFTDWAECFGLDTDSRAAEKTYRACLDIALALRATIGDVGVQRFRDAYQDY